MVEDTVLEELKNPAMLISATLKRDKYQAWQNCSSMCSTFAVISAAIRPSISPLFHLVYVPWQEVWASPQHKPTSNK